MKFSILVSLFFASAAFAGGVSDGGGSSVVCRDSNQNITSVELLDLFEARSLYGRQVSVDTTQDFLNIALQVAKTLDDAGVMISPTGIATTSKDGVVVSREFTLYQNFRDLKFFDYIGSQVRHVNEKKILLPQGVALKPVSDYNSFIIPTNCKVEQTALYKDDTDQIFVVGDIWDKMDSTNRAALLLHEALYSELRGEGETSSDNTRLMVGMGFSNAHFEWVLKDLPKDFLLCSSDDENVSYRIAVYASSPTGATFQFLYFNGQRVFSKTTQTTSIDLSPLAPLNPSQPLYYQIFFQLQSPTLNNPLFKYLIKSNSDNGGYTFSIGITDNHSNGNPDRVLTCRPFAETKN